MSERKEAMWLVVKQLTDGYYIEKSWVFRTRSAARSYAESKRKRASKYEYYVQHAVWGPEQ
jgi:hypothetical protein